MSQGMSGLSPANVAKYVLGVNFPVKKQELLEQARKNGAPQEVQQVIQELPNQEFHGTQDVMKAYTAMR